MLERHSAPIVAERQRGAGASLLANGVVAGLGLVVLAAGSLVYLLDRPAESAPFFRLVSLAHLTPAIFGKLGQNLPTFSHTFAFSLFTAACLGLRRGSAVAACLGWGLIDMAFEIGQHAAVAPFLSERMLQSSVPLPFLGSASVYFESGTFDLADVASIIAGAAIAYLVTRWAVSGNSNP